MVCQLLIPAGIPAGIPDGIPAGIPDGMPAALPAGMPDGIPAGMPVGILRLFLQVVGVTRPQSAKQSFGRPGRIRRMIGQNWRAEVGVWKRAGRAGR